MKKKMGRPRLSKSNKDVLIGTRFGSDEANQVEDAAKRSKQSKSVWVRNTLLWAARRVDVKSDKWRADDLDGQTVKFKMIELPNTFVQGTGKFIAFQRGDGVSMDLRIITRDRRDTDPMGHNDIPVSQRGIDLLKKSPPGSECAFSLIDPNAP